MKNKSVKTSQENENVAKLLNPSQHGETHGSLEKAGPKEPLPLLTLCTVACLLYPGV